MMGIPPSGVQQKGERIAKRIARAGLCSRRDAERWVAQGRVSVNGHVLTTPATVVTEEMQIRIDGHLLQEPSLTRLWLYHKPAGLLTTHYDPQGRPTLFASLPPALPRVISVGRLDMNSEGLILLTTNGGLSRYAELPSTGWARSYRVRVHGMVDEGRLTALAQGATVEGVIYGPIKARIEKPHAGGRSNTWLAMTLYEGKNREIRKVLAHLNLQVNRLVRISYGPFLLGDLKPSQLKEIPYKEIQKIFPVTCLTPAP